MKILYIHELFPPDIVGGGEIYAENIVTQLKKRGHDVFVVAGTYGKTRSEKYKGIPVYRINFFPTRYFFNFKTKQIEKIVKKFRPDIIHANALHSCMPAYKIGKKYNIPVVVNVHFFFQKYYRDYFGPLRTKLFSLFERFIMSFPYDKIIALDYYVYKNLKKNGKKPVLIEHPIDTKKFKRRKRKSKKFVVGTVITLGPTKRNDLFISLAKKLKNKNIEFLAIGPYTNKLKKQLDNAGIVTTGRISHDKMPEYYNKMNVYFGHGMAAKEAMACGCVAILNEPTKRLLRFHKKEIKAKIMLYGNHIKITKYLLENPKKIKLLSKKSVNFIRKVYSADKIISEIIDVYKTLIKR